MLTVTCPGCRRPLRVKDDLAGKKVRCPAARCRHVIAVPPAVAAATPAPAAASVGPPPPSPIDQAHLPLRSLPLPDAPEPDHDADAGTASPHDLGAATADGSRPGDPAAGAGRELTDFLAPAETAGELGRLGGYRVLEVLGRGGMGVVFRAEDPRLQRQVALKVMLPALAASATARERFLREARVAAAVEHDHVVVIHQVGEDRGVPFLAMPLLHGEPLDARLKREGRLPVPEVLRIGREAALGLAAAHARGLVHRDVKPANFWLEEETGRVKVLDFGLARAAKEETRLTRQGTIIGTPAYMAPEQANGLAVDAHTDLFSLGCVLYRMATGQAPFKGNDMLSTLLSVASDDPAPASTLNPEVPPGLSDLIGKLLSKKPAGRPASAPDVVQTLRILERDLIRAKEAEDRTVASDAAPPVGRAAPPRRRRRLAFLVAGLVLLGGLLAGGTAALIRVTTDQGNYVIDTDDPDFLFQVHDGAVTLQDRKNDKSYTLKVVKADKGTGEWELEAADGGDLAFKTKTFTVKRGEKVVLRAWFERKDAADAPGDGDVWARWFDGLPADRQGTAVGLELKRRNPNFDGTVKAKVEDGVVTGLEFLVDNVTDVAPVRVLKGLKSLSCRGSASGKGRLSDLSPLQGMPLTSLDCTCTALVDLSPLKGMPLTSLACAYTKVSDLAPLAGMKLTILDCGSAPVADLSPLKGAPLTTLNCSGTLVTELAPLAGMPLTSLNCSSTKVSNLSPLKGMALTTLDCRTTGVADLKPLEGMPLTTLNCSTTKAADLSPLRGMKLTNLDIHITPASDLAPLQGMPLTNLSIYSTKAADLSPLKGMKLTVLDVHLTPVSDLAPLQGMPLTSLVLSSTKVADLSPLKGMKLTALDFQGTPASDLAPLQGMPLTTLYLLGTKVADLRPLKGMKLTIFGCGPLATDLAPLQGMPLTSLYCNAAPVSDLSPLAGMKLTILDCTKSPVSDLAPLAGMPLTTLNCGSTKIAELAPLKGMKLAILDLHGTPVADLAPVEGMPLTALNLSGTKVADLAPLKGLKLTTLDCSQTSVSDLAPLRDLSLTSLRCDNSAVSDLSPLKGMKLTTLYCDHAKVNDLSPLRDMPLKVLTCDFDAARDAGILRPMATLTTINGAAAKSFWKLLDDKKPAKKP